MGLSPRPEPLRVLRLITRLNVGGPAKHVAWLMTGLDPERFRQTLVTGRVQPGEDDMGPWLEQAGVDYRVLPGLGRAINPLADLGALARVLGLLVRQRPHILATHTSKAGFLGRAALLLYRPYARLRGWPRTRAVHTFHGHTFHGYFGPWKTRLFLALERFLAHRATWRIVVISPRQLQEIHRRYRVGRRRQFVLVPLGIDLEPFRDSEAGRRRFRSQLGLDPEQVLVGAVGRVAPVKNYPLFLETAARLKKERPQLYRRCRFVLVGGGPPAEMDRLQELARELDIADQVILAGNRDDPENFFPGLDVLMITSTNEGTPVSILEGGACGLPVLATAVGGVPDLLGEVSEEQEGGFCLRRRGLSASSGDAAGLAAGLAWLLDHSSRAAALGASLRDYVHRRHDKARLVRDIAALYQTGMVPPTGGDQA